MTQDKNGQQDIYIDNFDFNRFKGVYDKDVSDLEFYFERCNKNKDIRRNNRRLKEVYDKHGQVHGVLMKIRVRPRGPRRPDSHDTLIKDARYFDIYKSEDTTGMWLMKYKNK